VYGVPTFRINPSCIIYRGVKNNSHLPGLSTSSKKDRLGQKMVLENGSKVVLEDRSEIVLYG